MDVFPLPCLHDNYAYLLVCPQTQATAVVDPSAAEPVQVELQRRGLSLTAILNTHHHWDHVGGNEALLAKSPGIRIFGHASDRGRIPGQTEFLEVGDVVRFGKIAGRILHNPGHTSGAISYVFGDQAFTGDTLFAAGCGRVFEGTMEQMHHSLNGVLGGLPDPTRLYFGHEYTERNLEFAQSVEPDNAAVAQRLDVVRQHRRKRQYTTPTTLAEERQTNPFLRCGNSELRQVAQRKSSGSSTEVEVFGVLRGLKDRF
ncbi:MAG TPA: hydroxyacylglutathione hydrolase [Deltaproteobacteria bacterium]|nr:hydroxyacylglutathione hydrolase [Deltaproteobacteria bacterium]